MFPEGLDKYTHTHTHTHTHMESITSKVNQGAVTLSSENTPSQDRNGQRTQKYPDSVAFSFALSSTLRCPDKEIANHGSRDQRSHMTVPVDLPTYQFTELCALRCIQ